MRTMGIRMEVKLTDGYQQRFTSACLAQIGSRKEETKIEDGNEGWKDHADRSGQHTDGDHKILELNEVRPAQKHDDRRLQQGTAGQVFVKNIRQRKKRIRCKKTGYLRKIQAGRNYIRVVSITEMRRKTRKRK